MRIAILSDASVVHTHRWSRALIGMGHDVELWSLESVEGCDYPHTRGHSRVPLRFLRYPLASGQVRRFLDRFQPDLVNAHFVPNYGLIATLIGRRPLVVSVWGSDVLISGRKSVLHRARARYVLERADAITTDAEMLTRAVIGLGGDPEIILTVPMGVELAAYRAASAARGGEPASPVVVSTRKLEPVYNVGLFVDAMPHVLERVPAARFVVVGDGPLRGEYTERARQLGGSVVFRGMIPHAQMATTLAEAQVYVSTSLSDSTSVSLLEAMAAGAFPVVTDIEANREWIEDGENGFLVPLDEPRRLADRVAEALADSELRERGRRMNRRIVSERADWHDNMRQVEALFERHVRQRVGAGV